MSSQLFIQILLGLVAGLLGVIAYLVRRMINAFDKLTTSVDKLTFGVEHLKFADEGHDEKIKMIEKEHERDTKRLDGVIELLRQRVHELVQSITALKIKQEIKSHEPHA